MPGGGLRHAVILRWLGVVVLSLATASSASAQDRWSDPATGVRLLTRTAPGPVEVRAAFVDRCAPGVRPRVTHAGGLALDTAPATDTAP